MNQIKNMINGHLLEWGNKQKQLPTDNLVLKSEVMARLQPVFAETPHISQQIPWVSFVFSGLAILILFVNPTQNKKTDPIVPTMLSDTQEVSKNNGWLGPEHDYSLSYYPRPDISVPVLITDIREFMKINYSATVYTRRVDELTQIIQSTIRVIGGRIDSSNSSKQSGYMSFVVPASKFEDFRLTIKNLAGERFMIENIYNENLLPQKQSIEQQKTKTEKILTQLKSDKNQLKLNHEQTINAIQLKINQTDGNLTALKIKLDVTSDLVKREELKSQINKLLNERNGLEIELADENNTYAKRINALDVQIYNNQTTLDSTIIQDQRLTDTVATVHGTISLNRVSLWGVIRLYVPINWGFIIFGAGAIIAYLIHRRRLYTLPFGTF